MDSDGSNRGTADGGERDDEVDDLVAGYVDRLSGGERIEAEEILSAHPTLGEEILGQLEVFTDPGGLEDELIGTLGDYTLRRQIGRGGMGVVYDAWENSMDRRVALKVLPAALAADQRSFLRFMREAKTAGQLSHPNVVAIYAMGVKDQVPYYAMEYVDGETLAGVLARLRRAEPDSDTIFGKKDDVRYFANIAEVAASVADGLQHAHSRGIVHRDIKPPNLILDREGRLRILDFGLARLEGQASLSASGDVVGTPLYMSPEQARRRRVPVDHRTDIYSLGATLYEVLAGRPPFEGKDHGDTLSQIIERDPVEPRKINPRVPKDLATIVLKCLRKEPGDRYGTAEALAQDLRRFVRGDAIEARPQQAWERRLRAFRRARWRVAGVLLALLLLLTSGLLLWKEHLESERRTDDLYRKSILDALVKIESGQNRRQGRVRLVDHGPQRAPCDLEGTAFEQAGLALASRALEELDDAVALRPRKPEGHYLRARALLLLDRDKEAGGEVARALEIDPEFGPATALLATLAESRSGAPPVTGGVPNPGAAGGRATLWRAAELARGDRRWPEAIAAYDQLIDGESREPSFSCGLLDLLLRRGSARLEVGEYDGALEDFTAANTRWPELLEPSLLVGRTYILKKRPDVAEARFTLLHASADSPDDAASAIAGTYATLGDWQKSLEWSERIGDEAQRERMRAGRLLGLGRLQEAAAAATRSIEIQPRNDEARYLRGTARCSLEDLDGAIADFSEAIEIRPGNYALHYSRAMARYRKGDTGGGLSDVERVIAIEPGLADAYNLRALLREQGKDLRGALADLDEALRLNTRFTYAYINRSTVRLTAGDPDGALADLKEALRVEPRSRGAHFNLGIFFASRGDQDGAIREFSEVIEIDPRDADGYSNRGLALVRSGRVSEALADCNMLVRIGNVDPESLYLAAVIQAQVSERVGGAKARATEQHVGADQPTPGGEGTPAGEAGVVDGALPTPRQSVEEAVKLLRRALANGFKDLDRLRAELSPTLLGGDPDFRALLEEMSRASGAETGGARRQ